MSWFADEADLRTIQENDRNRREASIDPSSWFADESETLPAPSAVDSVIQTASVVRLRPRPDRRRAPRAEAQSGSPRPVTPLVAARAAWPLSSLSQWSAVQLLTFSGLAFVVGFAVSLWVLRAPDRVPEPAAPSAQASNVDTATPPNTGSRIEAEPNRPAASRALTPADPPALPARKTTRSQPTDSTQRARLEEGGNKESDKKKTASPMLKEPLTGQRTIPVAPLATPAETTTRPALSPGSPASPVPVAGPLPAAESLTPVPAVPLPEIVAPRVVEARSPAALEEVAVRQALGEYVDAYEGLDVDATAQVWPTVDRQALTRAFASLKSQGLAFAACHLDMAEATAVARCHGTVQFVRRVGNPTPRVEPQQWLFRMRKLGTRWKIEDVTAGPGAASATGTVRGSTPQAQRRH
jgi:hypothetical protein